MNGKLNFKGQRQDLKIAHRGRRHNEIIELWRKGKTIVDIAIFTETKVSVVQNILRANQLL